MHRISDAALGFLITGPVLEGTLTTEPIPEGIPKVALPFQRAAEEEATPSQPMIEEGEEVVEVSDSEDDFEVFNRPLSPEVSTSDLSHSSPAQSSHHRGLTPIPNDIGIQRKPMSTLQELLGSQPGRDALGKVA